MRRLGILSTTNTVDDPGVPTVALSYNNNAERSRRHSDHSGTRLDTGRAALLIDCGSRGNLSGSNWMREAARTALTHNLKPSQIKRPQPLSVNGSQAATHGCEIPVGLIRSDGSTITGTFMEPTINDSDIPALLGLDSLRASNAVPDFKTLQLHMCGPAGAQVTPGPGSSTLQWKLSPSGQLMLSCRHYITNANSGGEVLTCTNLL